MQRNQVLERVRQAILGLFIVEAGLKIVAQGFIMHRNAYLRDAWNWIDFMVVVVGVVELTPLMNKVSLKSLRTLRVIRPLRNISGNVYMRKLIQAMIDTIPSLFSALALMAFVFVNFAIFGTQ